MRNQLTNSHQTRTATRCTILIFACSLFPLLGGCPPPRPRVWTVTGRILDGVMGDPIADAEIVLCLIWADGECDGEGFGRTESDGSFELPRVFQSWGISQTLIPIEARVLVRTESLETLFTVRIEPGNATIISDAAGTVRLPDAQPEFTPRSDISLTILESLEGVVLSDIDGDGDQDIIISTFDYFDGPDKGFAITNMSPGIFSDPVAFDIGDSTFLLRAFDVNGDNRPDLISLLNDVNGCDILIQLNDGQGAFATSSVVETDDLRLTDFDLADVNGDGLIDLVAVGYANDDVAVFINDGTAVFSPPLFYSVGARPNRLVASDVDLDGDVDLVTSTDRGIAVLFNDASGQFQAGDIRDGDIPLYWSLVVADMDGDGDPDIVSTNLDGLVFHRNDGNGTFALIATQDFPFFREIAVGDFDGDGVNDLVATVSEFSLQNLYLLLNDGTGLFQEALRLSTGRIARAVTVGDLDGNATSDVVVINGSETISIFLNPLAP